MLPCASDARSDRSAFLGLSLVAAAALMSAMLESGHYPRRDASSPSGRSGAFVFAASLLRQSLRIARHRLMLLSSSLFNSFRRAISLLSSDDTKHPIHLTASQTRHDIDRSYGRSGSSSLSHSSNESRRRSSASLACSPQSNVPSRMTPAALTQSSIEHCGSACLVMTPEYGLKSVSIHY